MTDKQIVAIKTPPTDKIEVYLPKDIPLMMWFSSGPKFDREEYLAKYPDFTTNMELMDLLPIMNNIDELIRLKKYFEKLRRDYLWASGNHMILDMGVYRGYKIIFDNEIRKINDRINELVPEFKKDVGFAADDYINGYHIGKFAKFNFPYELFCEFKEKWQDDTKISFKKFREMFSDACCTEWYKHDHYGNCYGGPWDCPEGSYAKVNAWRLCGIQNCRALYKLPYPKKFILYAIKIGCGYRLDTVPFVNYMCEWTKRKIEQMYQKPLNHLMDAWNHIQSNRWDDIKMNVCLIQDGWEKATPEMKEYLKKMFPKQDLAKNFPEFQE